MSGDIWAARDWNGELYQFDGEPDNNGTPEKPVFVSVHTDVKFDVFRLPDDLLPSLKPGEKCRVRIERCE